MSLEENRKIVDERYNQIKENLELSNNSPVFMPTSYIETKVQEFHNKVCDSQMFDEQGNEITDEVLSFLESALTDLLSKAMECVPPKTGYVQHMSSPKQYYEGNGHNSCREQTLTNLSKLQSNK